MTLKSLPSQGATLGINFIKLGLQDVLLNPTTMDVFTPNTGQTKNLKTGEERARGDGWTKGDHGYFTGSTGSGGGGSSSSGAGSGKSAKKVDKSSDNGVEYGTGDIKTDFNGNPYTYPEFFCPKKSMVLLSGK